MKQQKLFLSLLKVRPTLWATGDLETYDWKLVPALPGKYLHYLLVPALPGKLSPPISFLIKHLRNWLIKTDQKTIVCLQSNSDNGISTCQQNLLFFHEPLSEQRSGGLLQDAREAVCELANCSVKNFSSLTRFSGLQDFPSWRTR